MRPRRTGGPNVPTPGWAVTGPIEPPRSVPRREDANSVLVSWPPRAPVVTTRRAVAVGLTAAAAVGCWAGWMGWDRRYDVDAVTGQVSGPYQPWQVVGCVLCLLVVVVAAVRWLTGWVVIATVPVAFTLAWAVSANTMSPPGGATWAVGAVGVLWGSTSATTLVALPADVAGRLWWRHRVR